MVLIGKPKETEIFQALHGGVGRVRITKIITHKNDLASLHLFAKVTVDVGASIGYHEHLDDSEAYYIVSGEAIFLDHKKIPKEVTKDDFCYIYKGQGHGIINRGNTPLEMIAIVLPN